MIFSPSVTKWKAMTHSTDLRQVLEAVRRHVERATAGTGLEATRMKVDLRFGLNLDENAMVKTMLSTDGTGAGASHSLQMEVALAEDKGPSESSKP